MILNNSFFYKYYKEEVSSPLPYPIYKLILKTIFIKIRQKILQGDVYYPAKATELGHFRIFKEKRTHKKQIDMPKTAAERRKGSDAVIYRTNPYFFKPAWVKYSGKFDSRKLKSKIKFRFPDGFVRQISKNEDILDLTAE